MPLALRLAHLAAFEPPLADRARVASAEAIRRHVSAGLVLTADEEDAWREDFEAGFIEATEDVRKGLAILIEHPLAAMFPTLAVELYCGGLSADEVLGELGKVS